MRTRGGGTWPKVLGGDHLDEGEDLEPGTYDVRVRFGTGPSPEEYVQVPGCAGRRARGPAVVALAPRRHELALTVAARWAAESAP